MKLLPYFACIAIVACASADTRISDNAESRMSDDAAQQSAATPEIIVSAVEIDAKEGESASFMVSLSAPPEGATRVSVASTDALLLPDPPVIDFTSQNWNQPVTVRVDAPKDLDDADALTTMTLSGTSMKPQFVRINIKDPTTIHTLGWNAPFSGTRPISGGSVIAFPITANELATITAAGIYAPVGIGDYRLAIYADDKNQPGALLAQVPQRMPLKTGVNETAVYPALKVDHPYARLWIAIRTSNNLALTASPLETQIRQCSRDMDLSHIDTVWPAVFGAATCVDYSLTNVWVKAIR